MNKKMRWIILSVVCFFNLAGFAEDSITDVYIKAKIEVEETVDGKQETKILSTPAVTTASGFEAKVGVYSTFTNAVPNHEEHTTQTGKCGSIFRVTPYVIDSDILLKGQLEIRHAPTSANDDNGIVAVQSTRCIQFSLKLSEELPHGTYRTPLPDGSTLILSISVSTTVYPARAPGQIKEGSQQTNDITYHFK